MNVAPFGTLYGNGAFGTFHLARFRFLLVLSFWYFPLEKSLLVLSFWYFPLENPFWYFPFGTFCEKKGKTYFL
jgi:hypothetical protein